jgi:hypothetical protein
MLGLGACAETPRTSTNFCRVLDERLTDITRAPQNTTEVQRLIDHYSRLVEVAPIGVQDDLVTLRDLLVAASEVKVDDEASVQALADRAYAAERAAEDAGIFIAATCGVDVSSGLAVDVPTPQPTLAPADDLTNDPTNEPANDPANDQAPAGDTTIAP